MSRSIKLFFGKSFVPYSTIIYISVNTSVYNEMYKLYEENNSYSIGSSVNII